MIWYFIAGFVSGAVGIVKFTKWLVRRVERNEKSEGVITDPADSDNSSQQSGRDK